MLDYVRQSGDGSHFLRSDKTAHEEGMVEAGNDGG
jgi:hypothetical protein